MLACGESANGPDTTVVMRDSAGITIVEHPAGALASTPLWRPGEATVTIGGPDVAGDLDATDLIRGWLLDEGFVAHNARESRFLLFGADGTPLRGFGKRGEGPDEFFDVYAVPLGGDSLLLVDPRRSETRVMRADLTVTPAARYAEANRWEIQPFGMTSDGALIALHRTFNRRWTEMSGPSRRDTLPLLRYDAVAARWDTVALMRDMEMYPVRGHEGGRDFPAMRGVSLGPTPLHAVQGNEVLVVDNAGWGLELHDRNGLRRSIRLGDPLRPVTQEMRDSVIAEELRSAMEHPVPEPMATRWRQLTEEQRFADSVAPYDRVLNGRDGRLWLRINVTPIDTTRDWLGFSAQGRLERRILLPDGWGLLAVDHDRVLVRRTDADDIGYLDVRPLERITP